jgi:hypothetical protein
MPDRNPESDPATWGSIWTLEALTLFSFPLRFINYNTILTLFMEKNILTLSVLAHLPT